ncbi:MAG: molybdenum cofactor guanylyltransferase MobA [Calditrichia bacterium]
MKTNQPYLHQLSVALIIGGKSRRFGSLKQIAKIKDRKLIELAMEKAGQLSRHVMAVTGPHRFDLPAQIDQYNDIYAERGPLGGIHTALHYCQTEYCAMIPCDMPLLNPDIYRLLYQFVSSDKPVAAVSHRGKEPLVSIWPKKLLPAITKAIQQNHLKLFRLLDELSAGYVDLPSALPDYQKNYFCNINTPEDLGKILEMIDEHT